MACHHERSCDESLTQDRSPHLTAAFEFLGHLLLRHVLPHAHRGASLLYLISAGSSYNAFWKSMQLGNQLLHSQPDGFRFFDVALPQLTRAEHATQ
jgi:hypothetical protein